MSRFATASRKTWVCDLFVLADKVGKHTVLSGDLVHGCQVDVTKLFDVDRSSILDDIISH